MRKILVVDDEAAIRGLLASALEEEGYTVITAANGRAAVELATHERPDLILTDVMMPELDGLGIVRHLRSTPNLLDVPVILMSAVAGPDNLDSSVTFVTKPFDLDHLLAVVARALTGSTG